MKLYYHETDGGAKYLFDTYIQSDYCDNCEAETPNDGNENCDVCGTAKHKEGTINDETKYIVRMDGNIKEDAELTIRS